MSVLQILNLLVMTIELLLRFYGKQYWVLLMLILLKRQLLPSKEFLFLHQEDVIVLTFICHFCVSKDKLMILKSNMAALFASFFCQRSFSFFCFSMCAALMLYILFRPDVILTVSDNVPSLPVSSDGYEARFWITRSCDISSGVYAHC
ncbi:uncharacterized protein LOC102721077 isoform X1 [Oryza brachyantha]|uniref:uncharacterized protein LOC102721077 isoform X1 n=1 Tax=Oryza brachyantha TaxID=4533 RepID=UPI000776A9C5|nr:uncharacterized protein LOC102721077 isoform X1 [Oryza brachyantha]